MKSTCTYLLFLISFFRVRMSWNFGDKKNFSFKRKSKLGLYKIVLTTPKTSVKQLTLTIVEMKQLPDIEITDSKEELSRFNWTIYDCTKKVLNFKTETDKLIFVGYCYWNSLYSKDNEVDLQLTKNQAFVTKRVYLLNYMDIFHKWCIVLIKQLFINKTNFVRNGFFVSNEHFLIVPGIKNVIWAQ